MHEEIEKFSLDGLMDDSLNLIEEKNRLVRFIEDQMREKQVAPVLDLEPQMSLDYIPQEGHYKFRLSVYGAYVGEGCRQAEGVSNGKILMKPTTKDRSSQ